MATEKAPNVPPFVSFCTASVPMVFDNSMSYYECLCALSKYLQDLANTVNFNATQLDGLQESFKTLKEYVDNYFANLDVQEEINNKLDEMAEGGELAAIIAQFLELGPVFAYDTVSDMSAAENLTAGCVAKTLGYTTAGDGKAAFYKIETLDEQDIDGNVYIAVGDSLVAHKNIEYGYADTTNPIYYGADPTGTVDSADAIQACINANKGGAVVFSGGKYIVNSSIDTPYYSDENVSINFNGATLYTTEVLSYVLGIGTATHGSDMPNRNNYSTGKMGYAIFDNLVIDAPNALVGILTEQNYWLPKIFNTSIFGVKVGIKVGRDATQTWSSNVILDNVYIQCTDYKDTDTRGIIINGHDNRITRLTVCNAFNGIEINKNGNYLQDIIVYLYGHLNERNTQGFIQTFPNTVGIVDNGNGNKFTGVYVDTYGTSFKAGTAMGSTRYSAQFISCDIFCNTSGYDLVGFDFSQKQIAYVTIANGWFDFPSVGATTNGHVGIKIAATQRFDTLHNCLRLENNTTFYLAQPDLLRLDDDVINSCPYDGVNNLTANKYYKIGYTPIQAYGKYVVRMSGTGNDHQACTINIGSSYNVESITNFGTSGSRYGIGAKVVTFNGVHYLELSVMSNTTMSAILGISVDKQLTSIGFGIIPELEPHIVGGVPIETTPTETTTFAA